MRGNARDGGQPAAPLILLLDDNEVLMKHARIALEAEGFAVEANQTIELAGPNFGKLRPDLIVLDISRPEDVDAGWALLERLRTSRSDLPAVISTQDPAVETLVGERLSPRTRLMKKPYGWDVLIDAINELLADTPVG